MKKQKPQREEIPIPDLSKFTTDELCEIYANLNWSRWDERLGGKPSGFDALPTYRVGRFTRKLKECKHKYIWPIMERIDAMVGKITTLQWHHMHHCGMTKAESDRWLLEQVVSRTLL